MITTLDTLRVGQSGVIRKVGGEGALRRHLLDMGLTPGIRISLIKLAPLGDPLSLTLRGYELTLRREDARSITVETEVEA